MDGTSTADHGRFTEPVRDLEAHHYVTVHESDPELFETAASVIGDGLREGHRCFFLYGVRGRDRVLEGLRANGIDAEAANERGELAVLDARDVYLEDGAFDPEAAADSLRDLLDETEATSGNDGVRIVAEADWIPASPVDASEFLAYEHTVNTLTFDEHDARIVCAYRRSAFDQEVIGEALRSHPALISGDASTAIEWPVRSAPTDVSRRLDSLVERTDLEGSVRNLVGACRRLSDSANSPDEDVEALYERVVDEWNRLLSPAATALWTVDEGAKDVTLAAARTGQDVDREAAAILDPFAGRAWRAFLRDEEPGVERLDVDAAPDIGAGVFMPVDAGCVLGAVGTTPDALDEVSVDLAVAVGLHFRTALGEASAVSKNRRKETELDRAEIRLIRRDRALSVYRETDRALLEASTRPELLSAVCEAVTSVEALDFAWFGRPATDGNELTPRAWSGEARGYLDTVSLSPPADGMAEPSVRAARSGEPTFVEDVAVGIERDRWRRTALDRGFTTAFAVPVAVDRHQYGVLTTYSHRSSAFDDQTRSALSAFGDRLAFGIAAVERRAALIGDRPVELEFTIRDARSPLVRIARRADCRLELTDVAREAPATTVAYVRPEDTTPDALASTAAGSVAIEAAAPAESADEYVRLEFAEPFLGAIVAEYGATLSSMSVSPEAARATVTLAAAADVADVVDAVTTAFPEAELTAKQHHSPGAATDGPADGLDRLTDRQTEVLREAYRAGYFERPRRNGGEAIADSLDISSPTFHQHRRVAINRLLRTIFDGN